MMYTLICVLIFRLLVPLQCANILGLFPTKSKSHYLIFDSVMTELAKRGHNITAISHYPKSQPIPNFSEISCLKDYQRIPANEIRSPQIHNSFTLTNTILSEPEAEDPIAGCGKVLELLHSNQSFDLLMTEIFNTDIMLVFASKYNAPFVSFSPLPLLPWASARVGNPSNPSYINYPFSNTPLDRTNPKFYQRFMNTMYYLYAQFAYFWSSRRFQGIAKRYVKNVPDLSEIVKNTSLIFTYSHFSVNAPIPLVPNVIEIAGVQIKKVSPLPKELQKFLDESEHGVIYFSLGSAFKTHIMPGDKRVAFLDTFAQLPLRTLWKGGDLHPCGDKVYTAKWMPQRDILAHPKVKLFISHGGALGLNEAVYEGVPVLGIPLVADQVINLNTLKSYGAAEILHYDEITTETLLAKINKVLSHNHTINMNRVSQIYKDRPMSPMDTTIYWIEYVIRHNGAHHLRCAGADLSFYQYYSLDIIASFLALAFLMGYTIYCVYWVLHKMCLFCFTYFSIINLSFR